MWCGISELTVRKEGDVVHDPCLPNLLAGGWLLGELRKTKLNKNIKRRRVFVFVCAKNE
jgi:hypothetical protein